MDRQLHKKWFPNCPRHAAVVDQYMWPQKDTTAYRCYNGISHPIYDCKGWVNFSLPLEMYPPVHQVHPQIAMVRRPHQQYRGTAKFPVQVEHFGFNDISEGRTEGFYSTSAKDAWKCPSKPGFVLASQKTEPGKLPSPYGDATGHSTCNSCSMY